MSYRLLLPFVLLLLSSCAKFGYYTEQIFHQAKIQWHARDNEEMIKDPKVSEEIKHKILLVGEYKKFFYYYFSEKPTDIYTKTTMLENKAVSYLLIATPHTKIEPHEFEFIFVGAFPYIGFSKLNSAREYAKKLQEEEDLVTWIRPVYAYSTLGYLEDRILSSFFKYNDVELAELVFHELFHTIFFIKDEVDLNENLANLYGRELLKEYFKDRSELKEYLATEKKLEGLNKHMVEMIEVLQAEFGKLGVFLTNEKADEVTKRFVMEVFRPEVLAYCKRVELHPEDCKVKDTWNQAAFAAFMTYEEEQDFLEELQKTLKLDLKGFLAWLKKEHKIFKKQNKTENFTEHLKLKVNNAPIAAD